MIHSSHGVAAAGQLVAIVDPYSTGAQLAPALRALGVRPVAVVSPGGPPAVSAADLRPEDFDQLWYADQVDVRDALAPLAPAWVVAGGEEGVELADQLAGKLTPARSNVPGLTAARRHKGRAAEVLHAAGVSAPRTISTADEDAVVAWLETVDLADRPLVLKPPRSAGSDGVVLVEAGSDWRTPFRRLRGSVNALGVHDEEVVVQEYLTGVEYAVDTVSVDGEHLLMAMFRYRKEFTRYRTVDVLPVDSPINHGPDLFALTTRALDAVGLRHGAAHTEVIVTDDGPRVVEVNARLQGGAAPTMSRLASGDSQLDRYAAVLAGGSLVEAAPVTRSVRAVYLCVDHAGLCTPDALARLRSQVRELPSYARLDLFVRAGSAMPRTVDLLTTPGRVLLAHDSAAQLELDTQRVWELEREFLAPAEESVVAA